MELHGGNVHRIQREKNINLENLYDYSANINPLGVPERIKKLISDNLHLLEYYPDPDYQELISSIAEYNRIEEDRIIAGNGASEMIYLFFRALRPDSVLIVSPTFAEYEQAIDPTVTRIDHFELKENEGFELNLPELKQQLSTGKYRVVVVCNPNNPTGNFLKPDEVLEILKICRKHNTILFLDEAFIEFTDNGLADSAVRFLDQYENIFILRALTKFFAIPGLRLGYGITSNTEIRERIIAAKDPWSINCLADLAGRELLREREYIRKSKEWISGERQYVFDLFASVEHLQIYQPQANFALIKLLNDMSVSELKEKLLNDKILIRDASNFPFLDDSYFRIAIRDRKSNEFVYKKIIERSLNG
ncbi:MAG: threonine-phosphate decarboxylase [Candidatus Cloacimonetes bacterium]|nr:threonine-phosphate decarboxylase [Candidatus Cloacimonadota bacterium]